MQIRFEASEAQYEQNDKTGIPPISATQPCHIVIQVPTEPLQDDDPYVTFTYNECRIAPDGDTVAVFDDGFWVTLPNLKVIEAAHLNGDDVDPKLVQTRGMLFTDITIYEEV